MTLINLMQAANLTTTIHNAFVAVDLSADDADELEERLNDAAADALYGPIDPSVSDDDVARYRHMIRNALVQVDAIRTAALLA